MASRLQLPRKKSEEIYWSRSNFTDVSPPHNLCDASLNSTYAAALCRTDVTAGSITSDRVARAATAPTCALLVRKCQPRARDDRLVAQARGYARPAAALSIVRQAVRANAVQSRRLRRRINPTVTRILAEFGRSWSLSARSAGQGRSRVCRMVLLTKPRTMSAPGERRQRPGRPSDFQFGKPRSFMHCST
jgi:hypothetical protein